MELERAEKRYRLATADYARLAGFRHAIRAFLRFSEAAAAAAGLSAQHYQAMLVLRGWPEGARATIADLARQLMIKHNSAVGLVDRLVDESLVVRETSSADRRKVELRLTSRGRRVLAKLAAMHRAELERIGPAMRRFFGEVARLGVVDAVPPGRQQASLAPPVAAARPGRRARKRGASVTRRR